MKHLVFICVLFLSIKKQAQTLLFQDHFNNLDQWVSEYNSPDTKLKTLNNTLDIITPNGLTLWYKKQMTGNIKITYDAMVISKGGEFDRVSDLNCFWMAQDPTQPNNFFKNSNWRNGIFGNYYFLAMYYVGFGGNTNSTTRFRKYDGNFEAFKKNKIRPKIIKEYTDKKHLITPNVWKRIEITCNDNIITYTLNGETIFKYIDESPYKKGYFGFRTVKNHLKLKNFKVYQLDNLEQTKPKIRYTENLNRGVVAVNKTKDTVFISWRYLKSDSADVAFNIYRKTKNSQPKKINNTPITGATFFNDTSINLNSNYTYMVCKTSETPKLKNSNSYRLKASSRLEPFIKIPLNIPPNKTIKGITYSYSANDASVGDLDGDGTYEIILKWQPSLTKNPPQKGLTGEELIDAYTLDGRFLWRINLGKNIRAGAAYTQFLVYDFDCDGRAEIMCKTADGTIDGQGTIIGDSTKDWRTYDETLATYGKIVDGPEYLSVFEGLTGKVLSTTNYIPNRYPLDGWGGYGGNGNNDNTGGRADRFSAAVAYLDGKKPSALFIRGWYGRTVVAAWDFKDNTLKKRWIFDSKNRENPYSGQANHHVSVADVDFDGKDELCVGAMTIDDNGKGLYSTGLRHGDALSLSDMNPDRPGLEVFGIHESEGKTLKFKTPGVAMFDAKTGEILFSKSPGIDVGRGLSVDIDPTHRGFENWGGPGGLRDVNGNTISNKTPNSTNFAVWWDGDLTRELLDKNRIDKWNWANQTTENLLTASYCSSNNGTKATPCLSADIFGDWREEVIWRTKDNKYLCIYTTTIDTPYRIHTLMQDSQYRLSIAWQNVAYNQPPFTSYYFGAEMFTTKNKNSK